MYPGIVCTLYITFGIWRLSGITCTFRKSSELQNEPCGMCTVKKKRAGRGIEKSGRGEEKKHGKNNRKGKLRDRA